MTINELFGPRGRVNKSIRERQLHSDLQLEQWIIPSGSYVKIFETENFGWVVLPEGCMDKRGFQIPRRIFRY